MAWRRRENLHERLAREGGLAAADTPLQIGQRYDDAGIHGLHRPKQWDAVVAVEATLHRNDVHFVVLPDGSLVIEEDDVPEDAVRALAAPLARMVDAPFRAQAVRRDARSWAVGGRAIRVARLPEDVGGDEIVVSRHGGGRELVVDGERRLGTLPSLERLGEDLEDCVVRATRLEADLWEVEVVPL